MQSRQQRPDDEPAPVCQKRIRSLDPSRLGLLIALVLITLVPWPCHAQSMSSNQVRVAVEALKRLKGVDLDTKPSLKTAVMKVVEAARGTPQFVELVKDFKITGQDAALLEYAVSHPRDASGVDAIRLVLAGGGNEQVRQALAGPGAAGLVQVLGNAGGQQVIALLKPILSDHQREPDLHKAVVRALAQDREGAEFLLDLMAKGELGESLKPIARSELRNARWPDVQHKLAELLPAPTDSAAASLRPIRELVQLKGDAGRGAKVFQREEVGCSKCHQVNGQGTDFGPNLSEVGTKLAKEAIYEAILDPSAGIAFGYEPWQIELKNGDEAFGLLASETADEIAIKAQNGIVSRFKKSDVASKVQQRTSIMPSGLAQAMSEQDLVDLVEFLSSLKKPGVAAK